MVDHALLKTHLFHMPISCDFENSLQFQQRLQHYMQAEVLSEARFLCRKQDECKASCENRRTFYEGQLSYVGSNYDLKVDDRPLRVLIVGQEYGQALSNVSMSQRSEMIRASAAASFNRSGGEYRNLHMRGTTMMLRQLLLGHVGEDPEGEQLAFGHLFESFALVNFLLCTALDTPRDAAAHGGGKGKSTIAMRRNCAEHFARTMELLEPTLVIVQGQGVANWIEKAFGQTVPRKHIAPFQLRGVQFDMVAFDHPSAGGMSGYWGNSLSSRYFCEVVQPELERYRRSLFRIDPKAQESSHKAALSFMQETLGLNVVRALRWYHDGKMWTWDAGKCARLSNCVYWFASGDQVLYVGKATDLDTRMRSHWDSMNRYKDATKLRDLASVADARGNLDVWAAEIPPQKIGQYKVPNEDAVETALIWHVQPSGNRQKTRQDKLL